MFNTAMRQVTFEQMHQPEHVGKRFPHVAQKATDAKGAGELSSEAVHKRAAAAKKTMDTLLAEAIIHPKEAWHGIHDEPHHREPHHREPHHREPHHREPDNAHCCKYQQCPSNCSQVGSLVGATITQQRLQARAIINAGQYPASPCSNRGLVGFVDPIMLAKAKLQSTLAHC